MPTPLSVSPLFAWCAGFLRQLLGGQAQLSPLSGVWVSLSEPAWARPNDGDSDLGGCVARGRHCAKGGRCEPKNAHGCPVILTLRQKKGRSATKPSPPHRSGTGLERSAMTTVVVEAAPQMRMAECWFR